MSAKELVKKARDDPKQWFGDGLHDNKVIFGDNVFTVGRVGDYQDFESAQQAASALGYSWEQEAQEEASALRYYWEQEDDG